MHWDFLLENGLSLLTWTLAKEPESNVLIQATQQPDHRLVYLDYESEILNNRGYVRRWNYGEFFWLIRQREFVQVSLVSNKLQAIAELQATSDNTWDFKFVPAPAPLDAPPSS